MSIKFYCCSCCSNAVCRQKEKVKSPGNRSEPGERTHWRLSLIESRGPRNNQQPSICQRLCQVLNTSQDSALCGSKMSIAVDLLVLASVGAGTVCKDQVFDSPFDVSLLFFVPISEDWPLLHLRL